MKKSYFFGIIIGILSVGADKLHAGIWEYDLVYDGNSTTIYESAAPNPTFEMGDTIIATVRTSQAEGYWSAVSQKSIKTPISIMMVFLTTSAGLYQTMA